METQENIYIEILDLNKSYAQFKDDFKAEYPRATVRQLMDAWIWYCKYRADEENRKQGRFQS